MNQPQAANLEEVCRMRKGNKASVLAAMVLAPFVLAGCGDNVTLFNPSFINTTRGGVVPLVPKPESQFILVQCINRTPNPVQFILTIEREDVTDSGGDGEPLIPQLVSETRLLDTFPEGLNNSTGILFNCPVVRVGLGENLNFPDDFPGLLIGQPGTDVIIQGFGVPGGVNPLDSRAGNFQCGDTLIFEVITSTGVPGNVSVGTFLLAADTQPVDYSGPDTFVNARELLETARSSE